MDRPPLHLLTFGVVALERTAGHTAVAQPTRPRHLALLAILASADKRGRKKTEIARLLWPDTSASFHSLSETESTLRKALGCDPIISIGNDRQALNKSVLVSDIDEFRTAIDQGQFDVAVRLYKGRFLEGFALKNEPEHFPDWVDTEQKQLQRELLRALRAVVQAGDWDLASAGWDQVYALDRDAQEALAEYIHALLNAGLEVRARQEFKRLSTINLVEGVETSAGLEALGRRFDAPQPDVPAAEGGPIVGGDKDEAGIPGAASGRACIVAVLDFQDQELTAGHEWLSVAIAEYLAHALDRRAEISVISRGRAIGLLSGDRADLVAFATEQRDAIGSMASKLGADHLVLGKFAVTGDSALILEALLAQPDGSTRQLGAPFEGKLEDLGDLITEMTRRIVRVLVRLHAESDSLPHSQGLSLPAMERYTRGRQRFLTFTSEGLREAQLHYTRALEVEPAHVLARTGLGSTYVYRYIEEALLDHLQNGITHLKQAIELEPESKEPYRPLAYAYSRTGEFELARRAAHFSLLYGPDDAESYYFVAGVYHSAALMQPGRRYQRRAAEFYRIAVELDPAYHWAHIGLAHLYLLNGQSSAAHAALSRASGLTGSSSIRTRGPVPTGVLSMRGLALLRLGNLDGAEELLRDALDRYEDEKHLWAPHFTVLAQCWLARCSEKREDFEGALRAYRVARELLKKYRGRLGMGHHAVRVHIGMAVTLFRRSRGAEAAEHAAVAAEYLSGKMLDFNWVWCGSLAESYLELARYYTVAGQHTQALELLQSAIDWGWSASDVIEAEFSPFLDSDRLVPILSKITSQKGLPE